MVVVIENLKHLNELEFLINVMNLPCIPVCESEREREQRERERECV